MKIACLMMQKNEDILLEPWLRYYDHLFGAENIFLYDNGSETQTCREALKMGESMGSQVFYNYSEKKDFENKGSIFSAKIQELDKLGEYQMYFPLDCDEFIGVRNSDGTFSFDRDRIISEIALYKGAQRPLLVKQGLDNHPEKSGYFRFSNQVRKTFFPELMCKTLDHGFHDGQARTGNPGHTTNLVYLHYHYKPYDVAVDHSKQKLLPWLEDFSKDSLLDFKRSRGPGHHLVDILLCISADEYYSNFEKVKGEYQEISAFTQEMSRLKITLPYETAALRTRP
ncbi:glycosyltransferase family 2 protein [Agrobacterium tumefaciens]|uniref:glycosyltransferase family 2 protein n=1 Tax=Agrobacterium tumefaciens TaxID=358 RepID=UPI001574E67F|nr:hypothetical protein [Agrobacterium tumefaciens]NTD86712.1 hypothetical protein [Agrobacterium tumefaciens]NTD93957.1 hypothetical protein [Agrobacterium tumefaciens]NTE03932.1 hypothetical protein [Agrobacterium tumefaciens]NTE11397.1 hypothetical protein [Agrobacterium tumefaciens]